MSALYKRSNPRWRHLIEHRSTQAVWAPLVEAFRRRQVAFRKRLLANDPPATGRRAVPRVFEAGV
ncbi:MAG: hypothetical protein FJ090_20175 [Deltaproteobacteria bacterium]|nr:hypothetical protein [Deltaproteobacteria bacterium]